MSGDWQRLAVVRADRIGDVIISSSCLAPLREQFSRAEISWYIPRALQALFTQPPAGIRIAAVEAGGFAAAVRAWRQELRSQGFDALALLQPNRAVEWGSAWAGIPVRAGWRRARAWPQFLTRPVAYAKSEGRKHEATYNFDVLARLGAATPAALTPYLSPDPAARESLAKLLGADAGRLGGFAAFHLSAHGEKARVPLGSAARIAAALHARYGLRPLLIGTEREVGADSFAAAAGLPAAAVLDLRGRTSLAESAWLLAGTKLTIARDSGPAHLAAAMGGAVLALFVDLRPLAGPSRWRPLGPRVEVAEVDRGEFPLATVEPALARLLGR